MTAYVVVHATVKDADKLQEYGAAAGPTLAPFGGEFVARGAAEPLFGEHRHKMAVVLKFADADAAKRWYNSDAYQALLPVRTEAIDAEFILVSE